MDCKHLFSSPSPSGNYQQLPLTTQDPLKPASVVGWREHLARGCWNLWGLMRWCGLRKWTQPLASERPACTSHLLMGVWNSAATVENSLAAPQKVKHRITIWPETPLLHIDSRKMKTGVQTETCTWMFTVPLLKLPKGTNNPQVIHQMRNGLKMWYVCTMDYYLAVKRTKYQ